MDKLQFKKLDANCYLIKSDEFAINMYVNRMPKSNLYGIDLGSYYFEVNTIANAKDKAIRLISEGKLTNDIFEY